jgi:2-dehydro-3-deoxyphosphogluconate aldolase/(4S)-4-hydroxy-2-oxoglutarate aldolase
MRKEEVLATILETKAIAVIRMSDSAKLRQVVEAIEQGGIRAIEITLTTPSALETIADLAKKKTAGTLIGAGTVLNAATAEAVIQAGAEFVVSPVTNFDLMAVCRKNDIFVAPGAFSPTEILTAWERGADVVKVFPATSLGPKFFRDLKGPLPQVRLMPTGGVNIENAGEFIRCGACCVAIGTALVDKSAVAAGDWDVLTAKARALVESLRRPGA